jgi:hypothetical protein
MREILKDLVESKAIYYFAFVLALVALSIWVDSQMYTECRAHGFSVFYCIWK